jgi:hypothetical protein
VLARAGAGDGATDVALCTHGDVVFEILDALAACGVDVPADRPMRKGSTWALSVEGGRVVGARYLDPPNGT